MNLKVKSDTEEYEVVVNGIQCDFCDQKDSSEMMHHFEDQTVCEGCYDHFNERWE